MGITDAMFFPEDARWNADRQQSSAGSRLASAAARALQNSGQFPM